MRLKRQTALAALVVLVALACMGMGGFGDTDTVTKIPVPDRPFTVTVVDATDASFSVEDFSVEGLTLVPLIIGRAKVSVDFAKVRSVRILNQGGALRAVIALADGATQEAAIEPSIKFYGRTSWGLMQIQAKDIKEIRF